MADGGKSPIGGTFETINDTVVKPVADEVGKAIEQGVQSVIGPVPKPQPQDSRNSLIPTPDENARKLESRRILDHYKNTAAAQKQVRESQKQKQVQAAQQIDEKKEIKQFEIVKKQQKNIALEQATKKTETKGSIGG